MNYHYLSEDQIKGFSKYKYSSIDTSPLSKYVMHPFWNQVVKILPYWLAPNVLTFTGFLLTVANAVIISYYDYYFFASNVTYKNYPPIPLWVWLVCAINHFLAHTLDGVDGKQARRTNSSGPIGELMDHGLDSWTALFIPFCIYSMFGRGEHTYETSRILFIFWAIFFTFYFSHWEKYNTGVLYLPWSYDVSQLALFILYILTFLFTHDIWKVDLPVLNISSGQIFEIISHVAAFLLSIPITILNVYQAYRANELKQPNLWEALRPLIPFLTLFISTTLWAKFSPSDIIEIDPRMFYFMVGTVMSNISCRLIVSQMSSTRCEILNWLLVPLLISIFGIFNIKTWSSHELFILRGLTVFFTLAHIHYGICVIRQMCKHFNVYTFVLDCPVDAYSDQSVSLGTTSKHAIWPYSSK